MAASMVVWEEIMSNGRRAGADGERVTPDAYADMSSRDMSIRAIEATIGLAEEVGRLAGVMNMLEHRLTHDYKTATTQELESLRSKDKWFKRLVSAVVIAVAIAEVLRWLGLEGVHHG